MTAVSFTTEELFAKYISVTEDRLTAIHCAVILYSMLMDKELDYPETPARVYSATTFKK